MKYELNLKPINRSHNYNVSTAAFTKANHCKPFPPTINHLAELQTDRRQGYIANAASLPVYRPPFKLDFCEDESPPVRSLMPHYRYHQFGQKLSNEITYLPNFKPAGKKSPRHEGLLHNVTTLRAGSPDTPYRHTCGKYVANGVSVQLLSAAKVAAIAIRIRLPVLLAYMLPFAYRLRPLDLFRKLFPISVRAVYEFEAQPNSGELSISANEILTVVREGVQGGWLEGRNAKGQHGLFPESYVAAALQHHSPSAFAVEENWNTSQASHYSQLLIPANEQQLHDVAAPPMFVPTFHDDDDFDEWTDDDEEFSGSVLNMADNPEIQNYISCNPATKGDVLIKQATVRMKNINRQVVFPFVLQFSNFVKSGMEDYILLASKFTAKAEEHHEIILTLDGAEWIPVAQPYYCIVDKPKKESKLKGLKSFIAYSYAEMQVKELASSALTTLSLVSRRYKHFDWLYERMSSKYILIPLPPLPEKQVAGRYEEDFIEHRKTFCKFGSIKYAGILEQKVDNFTRSMRSFEESVNFMYNRVSETHKRLAGPYKTNWQKMGEACTGLCRSFDINPSSKNEKVIIALKETAKALHWVGDEHEKLAKKSLDPLLDALYSYKGMLACIPDIVNVHRSAISKLRENEKLAIEGRVSSADMDQVKERVDSISYMMLAEIAFQSHELGEDFKSMMATYLESQENST
ncbi:Sorting nexin [Dirofilaria immitis]|nr:Sorting nexin [Dirofilaria immitis]